MNLLGKDSLGKIPSRTSTKTSKGGYRVGSKFNQDPIHQGQINQAQGIGLPTWITLSRLMGAPLILGLLADPTPTRCWGAIAIFLVAAGTDWVDGYLARRLNQVTELGKFLDPLVDKLLVLAPLLALVEMGRVPAVGVFIILARELTIAGWRVSPTWQGGGVPGANGWGKAKTVVQIAAVALLLLPLGGWVPAIAIVAFWIAVGLTVISGLLYLLKRT